jgi:hypothetical protein
MLITRESSHMLKQRNYWGYSIACFLVWGILLALAAAKAKNGTFHNILLVFAGWTLCWVSATIARFVYPPPKRWLKRSESPCSRATMFDGEGSGPVGVDDGRRVRN